MAGPAPFDLLIAGGTVIDPGTGRSGPADVAIRNGKVAAVGDLAAKRARRTLDASGLLVTPGFTVNVAAPPAHTVTLAGGVSISGISCTVKTEAELLMPGVHPLLTTTV